MIRFQHHYILAVLPIDRKRLTTFPCVRGYDICTGLGVAMLWKVFQSGTSRSDDWAEVASRGQATAPLH
jgi:hypothetical protein